MMAVFYGGVNNETSDRNDGFVLGPVVLSIARHVLSIRTGQNEIGKGNSFGVEQGPNEFRHC